MLKNKIICKASMFVSLYNFLFWRIKSNFQIKYEKKVIKAQLKVFKKQLNKILKKLNKITSEKSVTSKAKKVALSLSEELAISYEELYPILVSLFETSANSTFELLGTDLTMDVTQSDVRKLLKKNFELVVNEVTKITNKRVVKQVVEGLILNEGYNDIAKRLKPVLNNPKRALTIARTETARYNTNANERAMIESKVVAKKQWQAESDACPICSAVNGEEVIVGEGFSVDGPPAHPNCRCDILPILKKK